MKSYSSHLLSFIPNEPTCSLDAVILAAGEGTRMKSQTPKVLHRLAGKTLLERVMTAVSSIHPQHSMVVIRHQGELVQQAAQQIAPGIDIVFQDDIPGTGRAVQCALAELQKNKKMRAENILVVAGDMPLLNGAILAQLQEEHKKSHNLVTILTANLDDPTGYGRIIRDSDNQVVRIKEEADATNDERAVKEVNTSVYIFDCDILEKALSIVKSNNAQNEIYLTDVIEYCAQHGKVGTLIVKDPLCVEGVNTRQQLSTLARVYNKKICEYWMSEGVSILDPATTWIDDDVICENDVEILPGSFIQGSTVIEHGAVVGPYTTLIDATVHSGATIERSRIQETEIGENATIGPWTYLRTGNIIGKGAKAGSFVEMKKAAIDEGTKVPHLSYIGDAHIGPHSNVGGGTITANYDGERKHHTEIGENVHVGAGNMFVAPVTVGNYVTTGAGSVVRHDVSSNSMVYSENTQHEVKDWELKRRKNL